MILDRFKLSGKVAVITGAGRGIGRGCALAFAEMGAHVVVAARTRSQIEETAGAIRAFGVEALPVVCDVLDQAQREHVVAATMQRFGRIDLLVNNAGGSKPKPALQTTEAEFAAALEFDVTTAFSMTRLTVPHMLKGDGGSIVNISSSIGRVIQPAAAASGTAKCALSFLTRLLAAEFAPRVRVNAINVGAVRTQALTSFLSEESLAQMAALTPMQRLGEVEDIALMALYLASPASSFVTGKVYDVDGGMEATNLTPSMPRH